MYWADYIRILQLFAWALVVHLVLLFSVFDIYFRSPVHVVDPVPFPEALPSLADRVVIFVGDGVRADSFFSMKDGKSNATFLRSILESEGMFGISHAHVPTESRPGHVAILSGMYEDPSAIFKGWQNYLVDFDSVFNRSEASFSWGSPDILNIFSRGSLKKNAYYFSYPSEIQEFSGKNDSASKLTYWVANNFERFLKDLPHHQHIEEIFRRKKNLFFFHFLGTDVAGHTSKPKSLDYGLNIQAVDECVQKIYNLVNEFFGDNRTAFIFTSDHGMTDWGSHGAGTDEETLTPIVTWGAGLNITQKLKVNLKVNATKLKVKPFPDDWNLHKYKRFDIEQADIAPLISALIGVPIPINSVGVLPVDFINADFEWILDAVTFNAHQLRAQFNKSHYMIKTKLIPCFYKPYREPNLLNLSSNGYCNISSKNCDGIKIILKACENYNKGIKYYNNYYSKFLLTLLSLMFIGWMLKLCVEIVRSSKIGGVVFSFNFHYLNGIDRWDDGCQTIFSFLSVLTFLCLVVQGLDINFYIYTFLTLGIWWNVVPSLKQMFSAFPLLEISRGRIIFISVLFLICLEFLVASFRERSIICYSAVSLNVLWAFEQNRDVKFRISYMLWFLSTFVICVFPNLPSVGAYRSNLLIAQAGCLWLITRLVTIFLSSEQKQVWSYFHIASILLSTFNVLFVDTSFEQKTGLFLTNQIISWVILAFNLMSLRFGPKYLHHRFIFLSHSLCSPFILLTSSHEGIFLCSLFGHLYIWMSIEYYRYHEFHKDSRDQVLWGPRVLKYSDFRIAFFFLTYILLAFFGLGNIASLNSFDPSWVRCYITMFSPFTMMALIVFKTVVPIFLVTCALRVIISMCQESLETIFYIVLLFCDVIGLHFFLFVTNEGSWLEIGTSLSHFILMEVLTVGLLIFYALALFLMPEKKNRREFGFYIEEAAKLVNIQIF